MDTVPPFIPSSEDGTRICGRGSCDAKGIIAAQIVAAEKLRKRMVFTSGCLFLVGEERDSIGAKAANQHPIGSRFMINGEPTENRLALASKGALHVELIARGKMAHSAYPELGESAIDKLVEALAPPARDEVAGRPRGRPCTKNVGIHPGRPRAERHLRQSPKPTFFIAWSARPTTCAARSQKPSVHLAEVHFTRETPFMKLRTLDGLPTMVAAFTTDIPSLPHWGEPLLLGPGSIHVAHTEGEYVEKKQLEEAVELYCRSPETARPQAGCRKRAPY